MPPSPQDRLSRRERQIMDILLQLGAASAEQVRSRLPDPPSNSATRAMLRKLEEKGQVRHAARGPRYLYSPTISPRRARSSAVSRLVRVFFGGSVARAVTGMLDEASDRMSEEELEELSRTVEAARRRRRGSA